MPESDSSHSADMANTITLLDRLKTELPEIWDRAQVVGQWVWLEFNVAPVPTVRAKLKQLGFHWNGERRSWQHPCGVSRPRSSRDPKNVYPVLPATALQLNETATMQQPGALSAKEYKVSVRRDTGD